MRLRLSTLIALLVGMAVLMFLHTRPSVEYQDKMIATSPTTGQQHIYLKLPRPQAHKNSFLTRETGYGWPVNVMDREIVLRSDGEKWTEDPPGDLELMFHGPEIYASFWVNILASAIVLIAITFTS